jgi:hypothetical protein
MLRRRSMKAGSHASPSGRILAWSFDRKKMKIDRQEKSIGRDGSWQRAFVGGVSGLLGAARRSALE